MFVAGFGDPGTDGELFCEGPFVVQLCAPSAQGSDWGPHKRLIFGCLDAFFVLADRFEHLLGGSAFESLLLRAQLASLVARGAARGCDGEVNAHVAEI